MINCAILPSSASGITTSQMRESVNWLQKASSVTTSRKLRTYSIVKIINEATMKLPMTFDQLHFIIFLFLSRLFNNKLTDTCTQHISHLLKTRQDFLSLRSAHKLYSQYIQKIWYKYGPALVTTSVCVI